MNPLLFSHIPNEVDHTALAGWGSVLCRLERSRKKGEEAINSSEHRSAHFIQVLRKQRKRNPAPLPSDRWCVYIPYILKGRKITMSDLHFVMCCSNDLCYDRGHCE